MPGYTGEVLRKRRWSRPLLMTGLVLACFFYSFIMLLLPRQLLIPFATPLMLLTLAIIWALPLTDARPWRVMAFLFWTYFVTLLLWPNYITLTLPGLPWFTAARLTAAPLVALMLIHASRSILFRDQMSALISGAPTIVKLVAGFAVIQFLSIVLSPYPFETANRVMNNEIVWTGSFFAAIWAFRNPRSIDRFALLAVGMTFILGLIAIQESRLGHVLWSQSIPSFFSIDEEYAEQIFAGFYRLDGSYRVIATSTTPLSFGELMAMAVPFVIYLVDRNPGLKSLLIAVTVESLILFGLTQADARSGFGGFIVAHFVYLALFVVSYQKKHPSSLLGPALRATFPVVLVLGASAILFIGRIRKHVLGGGMHAGSTNARADQFALFAKKIWGSPIFGFGAGQGGPKIGYMTPGGRLTIDSYYISIAMDYGFVGFFVFYGLVLGAIWKAASIALTRRDQIGQLSAAFASMLTAYLIIKSVLSQEANQPLLFIGLGAVVVLSYLHKREPPELLPAQSLTGSPYFVNHRL